MNAMKLTRPRAPKSWAAMDRVGKFPAPYIATRLVDGTIELKTIDPRRITEVYERDLCHLCGEVLNEPPSVIASLPQLSVGVSVEPQGHLRCLTYATCICPHLVRAGPSLIVTCRFATGARRNLTALVNNYLTVFGEVTHLAFGDRGRIVWQREVQEQDETDYGQLAREATMELEVLKRAILK